MFDPFRACSLKRPLQMQIAIVVTEETETMRRIMAVVVRTRNKIRDRNDLLCSRKAGIQFYFTIRSHVVD